MRRQSATYLQEDNFHLPTRAIQELSRTGTPLLRSFRGAEIQTWGFDVLNELTSERSDNAGGRAGGR